jgi:hypothetical protein
MLVLWQWLHTLSRIQAVALGAVLLLVGWLADLGAAWVCRGARVQD